VRSGPFVVGGVLVGIGTVAAIAGAAAVSPQHAWEQAKAAAAAGASTWRGHPNAKIRLVRRDSSAAG
jgi:hypothetical protein